MPESLDLRSLLDGAAAELCYRKTITGRDAAKGHDVSRVGYCVCLLLDRLPHRDARRAEAARTVIVEERTIVVDNSERTWLHAANM